MSDFIFSQRNVWYTMYIKEHGMPQKAGESLIYSMGYLESATYFIY